MKIANRISLLFFIMALTIASIATFFSYIIARDNLEEAISAHLVTTVTSKARHIETFLTVNKEAVKQFSQSIVAERLLLTHKEDKDYEQRLNDIMYRLKNTAKATEYFYSLFVLNKDGIIVASSKEEDIGEDRSGDSYFLGAKEVAFTKDAYISSLEKRSSIAFSAPITDDKTGKFLGVVVAKGNLDGLNKITTERSDLGKTGEIYLVNKYGYMITPSRFAKDTFLKLKVDNEGTRKAFEDIEKFSAKPHLHEPLMYTSYRGHKVLGWHDHIYEMQWVFIAEIDESEVFAPLVGLKTVFVLTVIFVPIAAWLMGIYVSMLIACPIRKLHKGAEVIGHGNLDYKVGTDAKDEVGQLVRAFDKMTEDLKKTTVSRDYVDNIIGSMIDVLVVVTPEEKIKTVNRAACELLGYKQEELIGKDVSLLFPEEEEEEEEIPFKGTKLGKLIKEGRLTNYEVNYKAKDGRKIPMLLSGAVLKMVDCPHKGPVKDCSVFMKKGKHCEKIQGIVCVAKDITEHKKAEETLKKAEGKYKTLFESSRDAIMTLAPPDWKFTSGNTATLEMFEATGEKNFILRAPWQYSPEHQPDGMLSSEKAMEMIDKAMKERSNFFEWRHKRLGGQEFPATVLLTRIELEGRQCLQATVRDITKRKKAERALEDAYQKLKETQQQLIQSAKMAAMGQLAAGISHELNQPLTGVKGFAQAALADLDEKSPIRADLDKIVEQTDRMDGIIQNVRFFAKKSEFKMEEIDINKPVEDSLMLLSQQLKLHNIRLTKSLAKGPLKLKGDSNQLQQAFLNFITNARDAIDSLDGHQGGEITVKTALSRDKKKIEVTFEDTGCGISKENLENIFNPFFTTKSPAGGVGLGLSIVYRIIEGHGGRVEVSSKEGKGTTFKIKLPIYRPQAKG
ncbi:MAG: PAS domain S-box protein [Candidatus Omnitrophota bacterium]